MNTASPEPDEALSEILSGREERAALRESRLSEGIFACQISLNIPGYPKRLQNDEKAVEIFSRQFVREWKSKPLFEQALSNGAGFCWLGFFAGYLPDAKRAKKIAVNIEEIVPQGRISDIDISVPGKTLSRSEMGLPPRSCLICGSPAKECARKRSHSYAELRYEFEKLIKNI